MRVLFGVLSLVLVLATVGVLVKKQMGALSVVPAVPGVPAPDATLQQQSQQLQHQVRQSVEGSLQQVRPMPDDK